MVEAFERLQEGPACFAGCRLSHDASAADGVPLGFGHGCGGVGQQVAAIKRFGMRPMRIQGWQQRRAFPHDSHAGMAATMNAPLVALGLSEPSLQVQVVPGQIGVVPADEQARLKAGHRLRHVLGDRVGLACQGPLEDLKPTLALFRRSLGWIERSGYVSDGLDLGPEFLLGCRNRRQAAVDAGGQTPQRLVGRPFFPSSKFRWREARIS